MVNFSTNIFRLNGKFLCLGKVSKANCILNLMLYLKMSTLRRERNLYSICLTVRLNEEKGQSMVETFQRNNIFRFF